ncbi:MAG: TonB-dependent receptor plug domain-containing protein, partial [Steroidobacteraceae bacterium]
MRLILSCTLGLSLCWTAWTPTLARASSPGAVDLEEVTVTALRRPQALLTHAGSIARIDAVEISELAATHHSELMNRAPGVLIQRGSGQESLTALRSPVLTGAGSCGAFLFLEDGLPMRPVGFCNVNELFEVNSEQASAVEIIRGPGSALYGSNAVHGIVNVINPTPAELPPLALGLEVGSDDYFRARLAASAPVALGEVGMVMHGTHDGGWRDASGFEEGKLAAAWAFDTTGGSWLLRLNATRLDQETAGFIQGQDSYRDPAIARSNANPEAYRQASSLRATATHQRELQDGDQLDLRLALRSSRMDFLQHFLLGKPLEENGQDSLAVFASRSRDLDTLRWVVGLDAELASGELRQSQDGPTTGGPPAAHPA